MVELITDAKSVRNETGLDLDENTLQSGIFLEGPRDRLPILVKGEDGSYTLVTRRIEIGNYIKEGRGAKTIEQKQIKLAVYDNYFTMSDIASEYTVYPSEAEAIQGELGISQAAAYDDMPYARYLRITKSLPLTMKKSVQTNGRFFAYRVDRTYVSDVFTQAAPKDKQLAMDILKERTHVSEKDREILWDYMNKERVDPFALLDHMLEEAQVNRVLADTKLSIHTLTALPWDEIDVGNMFAVYDKEEILLFAASRQDYPFLEPAGEYEGFQAMLKAAASGGSIGIEEKSLPVGYVELIGPDRCTGVSAVLTLWRDLHAYQFLPYYVINGIGNIYALDAAIAFAKSSVNEGRSLTERDIDKRYEEALAEFIGLYHMERDGFSLRKYFSGIQVGNRCPFAALSSDYPLSADMNTLKIDCGAHLFKNGILMSGSDECRSWCLTPETQEVYELLGKITREHLIPNIRDGMKGSEAYWLGVKELARHEKRLKEIGMLVPAFSLENGYERNIGHTFSKAESVSVTLDKRTEAPFRTHMICCVEYHWPYRDQSFGVEDMFFVTPEGAIDFVY